MEFYNSRSKIRSSFAYDETNDSYTLVTNAIDSWWSRDDLSFAWERVSLPYGECSRLEMHVAITSYREFEPRASAGLALRNSLNPESANVFLIVRRNTIFMTFRRHDGEDTYAVRSDMPGGLSFPLELKLVRQGTVTSGYFKEPGANWREVGTVEIPLLPDLYAGMGGYAYLEDYPITVVFQDYSAAVTNTEFIAPDEADLVPEELPKDVLMRERFEDGSVCRLPSARTNPVWSNVTQANIIELTLSDGTKKRVWHKHFMPGYHFAGNIHWTDYALEAEVLFTEACAHAVKNQVGFFVRQRELDLYGKFHYAVYLTGGNTISISKCAADSAYSRIPEVSAPLSYLDSFGSWNRIRIEAFDNKITVFWNGRQVLYYEDNGTVIAPFGRIGFMTEDTSVYLGGFEVTELEDSLGGAYDNLIGGLWEEKAPEGFVYEYDSEDGISFMSNTENATGY